MQGNSTKEQKTQKELKLSASRISTFQKCSYIYYCKYIEKIPEDTNSGALIGSACHTIFECLLKKKHRHHYDLIMDSKTPSCNNSEPIKRLLKSYIKKNGLSDDSFFKMDKMILVGLATDFFCEGADLQDPEIEFTIKSDKPKYIVGGFIDKLAIYKNKLVKIVDYKSSKQKFVGEELSNNLQAYIYSLAAKEKYPKLKPVVDFCFLQFSDDPLSRPDITEDGLEGFKEFLGDVYRKMSKFTKEDAESNLAAKQSYPKEGFKGPLVCGYSKYPNHIKPSTGEPYFACAFKWPRNYYALCNSDDEVIRTSTKKEDLIPKNEEGEYVITKKYLGCPHFRNYKVPCQNPKSNHTSDSEDFFA